MKNKCVIHVARTAGFCFGVRRAIRMAEELAEAGGKIHMLGDLVHNQDVIARLEKAGITKIARLGNGRGKILLIRAHGAGKRLMVQARRRGYKIVDATCPMVHAIHKKVREMDRKGCQIIVLGDRRHEEVQGIVGQIAGKTLVIDSLENIPWPQIKKIRKAAIVVQSTQNMDHILPIVAALEEKIKEVKRPAATVRRRLGEDGNGGATLHNLPKLSARRRIKFFNTICRPTRMKQAEMKTLPRLNDVVIVIGARFSANTRRLFEISRSLNPRSYWIESAAQLKQAWFKNAKSVGITAGASTPESATRSVIERIRRLTG